jgi:tripartite-type tricarboxylate transporter receptor subunit TctC
MGIDQAGDCPALAAIMDRLAASSLFRTEDAMYPFCRRAIIAGCLALVPIQGSAQEQSIRVVFPFAAGGPTDAMARLIADELRVRLGKGTVVENKTGAAGRIAVQAVKDAPPDGSTLLIAPLPTISLLALLYPQLGYNPLDDLKPISKIATFDVAIAAGPQAQSNSLGELSAWLKANPQHAAFGSPGAGTLAHFAGHEFGRKSSLALRHVAYRGTPAGMPDLLAGRLPMFVAAATEFHEQHKAGRIRMLATSSAGRSPFTPEVPTFKEAGFPFQVTAWWGIYAPGRTPSDIVERLNRAIVAIVQAPEIRARILGLGLQPTGTTSEALERIQRADLELWAPIVKASGFTAEQ